MQKKNKILALDHTQTDGRGLKYKVILGIKKYFNTFFYIIAYLIENTMYFNCKDGYDGRSYT
jgi:hypothetical protein